MDASELTVVAYVGEDAAVHVLPPGGRVTIGRAEDNDIPLADGSVSRHHCVIHAGPPLRVEDLGGANGTFLAAAEEETAPGETRHLRQLSRGSLPIAVGDRITAGATVVTVRRTPSRPSGATDDVVLSDPRMRALYAQADRAAQALINILILGETGVGKEVLARAIHERSQRAKGPFLGLNCAALSETLLESELFGHEKGAFTGAMMTRPGLFESADGGTVFLDEVGELPNSIQVKLLRVIEERRVLRVGGRAPRDIDVRFLSATNRDLEMEVGRGGFRQDLFFRLNGLSLNIPPLRERVGEIEAFARLFAHGVSRQLERKNPPTLAPETLAIFGKYAWPGNVRELKNVIERAIVLCDGRLVLPEHLPPKLAGLESAPVTAPSPVAAPAPSSNGPDSTTGVSSQAKIQAEITALERSRIIAALEQCAGNQTRAAEILGISRRTLATWLERHKIPRPRKRDE
jgi:two-component system, NtrC family, response regulator AtoC